MRKKVGRGDGSVSELDHSCDAGTQTGFISNGRGRQGVPRGRPLDEETADNAFQFGPDEENIGYRGLESRKKRRVGKGRPMGLLVIHVLEPLRR